MSEQDKNGDVAGPKHAERPETPPPSPPAERDVGGGYVPPNIPDYSIPEDPEEDDDQ